MELDIEQKKPLSEGYLDKEEKFYDYRTSEIDGSNIFDTTTTGVSYYNEFLNAHDAKYLRDTENVIGEIVQMTPEEYYSRCAKDVFSTTVQSLKNSRKHDASTIEHLKEVILQYKKKFPMTYINYADECQEGLHRMYVAGELFGWNETKHPVLVVKHADNERAEQEKQQKIKNEISSNIRHAIRDVLIYTYSDFEELEIQLQSELDRKFEFSNYVNVPVKFTIEETADEYIVKVHTGEACIDKDQIKYRSEDIDNEITSTELDDIDLDLLDDEFLRKYLGNDYQTEYPEAANKLRNSRAQVNESFDVNRENIIKVLDECNRCYYSDTSMVLNIICEKLYYNYGIDARYRGRSIYLNDQKLATIEVEKEGLNLLGMVGYKLFI